MSWFNKLFSEQTTWCYRGEYHEGDAIEKNDFYTLILNELPCIGEENILYYIGTDRYIWNNEEKGYMLVSKPKNICPTCGWIFE